MSSMQLLAAAVLFTLYIMYVVLKHDVTAVFTLRYMSAAVEFLSTTRGFTTTMHVGFCATRTRVES